MVWFLFIQMPNVLWQPFFEGILGSMCLTLAMAFPSDVFVV